MKSCVIILNLVCVLLYSIDKKLAPESTPTQEIVVFFVFINKRRHCSSNPQYVG